MPPLPTALLAFLSLGVVPCLITQPDPDDPILPLRKIGTDEEDETKEEPQGQGTSLLVPLLMKQETVQF